MSSDNPTHGPASPGASRRSDAAFDDLVPVVHDELRRIARRQLRRVGAAEGGVLSTDELVNEAYMKLRAAAPTAWRDDAHFFGVVAHAMRQILVDHARRAQARKRGGGLLATTLSSQHGAVEIRLDELIALDEALDRLDAVDSRLRLVVEYLFFGGMTQAQVADLLGVSTRTVEREWKKARMFLLRTLRGERPSSATRS